MELPGTLVIPEPGPSIPRDVLALVQWPLLWLLGHEIGCLLGGVAGRRIIVAVVGYFVRGRGGRGWQRGRRSCGSPVDGRRTLVEDVAGSLQIHVLHVTRTLMILMTAHQQGRLHRVGLVVLWLLLPLVLDYGRRGGCVAVVLLGVRIQVADHRRRGQRCALKHRGRRVLRERELLVRGHLLA